MNENIINNSYDEEIVLEKENSSEESCVHVHL